MIAILDRQHAGKRSSPGDAGAVFDLDGDGVKGEAGEREIDLTALYIAACRSRLESMGHHVHVLEQGDYGERHGRAIAIARADPGQRCAYVACHVNAGGGTYGLVEYDARSVRGAALADALAFALAALPEVGRGRARGMDSMNRGWSCIDGIYAGPGNLSAALFEPFFLDSKAHRQLATNGGCERVGLALADGLLSWG